MNFEPLELSYLAPCTHCRSVAARRQIEGMPEAQVIRLYSEAKSAIPTKHLVAALTLEPSRGHPTSTDRS